METIEPIYKGAQTAQRHLVELTRNQFTIHSEMQEKKDNGEIPECKILYARQNAKYTRKISERKPRR